MEAEPPPTADDPDIKDLELDWSQLNVDASTLTTSGVEGAPCADKRGHRKHDMVVPRQAEWLGRACR